MSQLLVTKYLNELSDLRRVSGTARESVVREAFKTLLKDWGKSRDLIFVPEYEYETLTKDRRYIDGALLHELRVPFGYWEAKDEKDDLDEEIDKKLRRGYPQDNIVFEDSREAILIQNKQEVMRCGVEGGTQLEKLLGLFFGYEREEIADFRKAVAQFTADLPAVLGALRSMIETAERDNPMFHRASVKFLAHLQETINPSVVPADVREMLIQHILTEEIFSQVFDNSDFHRHNNVAKQLYALEETFFAGGLKHKTLAGLRPYYAAIKSAAALVSSHHEKQTFLKVIYENFYKVYDKKKADRLGVAYTPNEIVRFIVEGTDWLCQKHFGKALIDKNVEILDPCVGTGTFITEMIEHFRGQPAKLRYKYVEELHCNEVAILPYYVANLNIEATYAAITQSYEEYPNLCFVDTLDNTAALRAHKGQQGDLFGAVSEENVARIKRQNKKKISVIIGNPPYNANQLNENENNKNREYPEIDRRIKATYVETSTAQKTKRYDMYSRFVRWASDRVDQNGIVSFITNRNYIDGKESDGFRKALSAEFYEVWIVDLGGDWKRRGTGGGGNVFGIGTGVAISFLVRKAGKRKHTHVFYVHAPVSEADEKLAWLNANRLGGLSVEAIEPDANGDWINKPGTDAASLLPIATKETRAAERPSLEHAIFKTFSLGVSTNRDDWVYDFDPKQLRDKIRMLIEVYEGQTANGQFDTRIKWSESLKLRHKAGNAKSRITVVYETYCIGPTRTGPSTIRSCSLIGRPFEGDLSCTKDSQPVDCLAEGQRGQFGVCASLIPVSLDYFVPNGACIFPRFRFSESGTRLDNITDWVLQEFRTQYEKDKTVKRPITKDAIFHYVYGVLHDPIYREKYALNLKREFPRIPFYEDFWKWADRGEKLMQLHIGYEEAEIWPLERIDMPDERSHKAGLPPKTLLKANKETGNIQLDSETQLRGVPPEAWNYKLGNRSALEWILDQYKEKTPKDPTIREKFNTYRFADYKEHVIDLLKRVTRVSVETVAIVEAMRKAPR